MTELSRIALESVRMLLQSALNIVLPYHVGYAFDAAQRRFPYFPCGLGAVAERLVLVGSMAVLRPPQNTMPAMNDPTSPLSDPRPPSPPNPPDGSRDSC